MNTKPALKKFSFSNPKTLLSKSAEESSRAQEPKTVENAGQDAKIAPHESAQPKAAQLTTDPITRFSFSAPRKDRFADVAQDSPPDYFDEIPGEQEIRSVGDEDDFGAGMEPLAFGNAKQQFKGIVAPLGLKERDANNKICGILASSFDQFDDNVPPGSHYESWIWDAMQKEGEVTVELYVDQKELSEETRMKMPDRGNPKFDPTCHVLMNIPRDDRAPWLTASRVLLVPKTYLRKQEVQKTKSNNFGKKPSPMASALGSTLTQPTQPKSETIETWESDPRGISAWLANETHHSVVFGACLVEGPSGIPEREYWIVVSRADALRIQHQVYGAKGQEDFDEGQNFGSRGVLHVQSQGGGFNRRTVIEPWEQRKPVPPAQRYLGVWKGDVASSVLQKARERTGPVLPSDWPKEDIDFVRDSHTAIAALKASSKDGAQATIIAPLKSSHQEEPRQLDRPRQRA